MRKPTAFTLIEVLLAMAIMAVICGTIYQFTGTTVRVADVATRVDVREQNLGGLRRLLAAQFAALPTSESQALTGETKEGEHGRADFMRMLCPAGTAVLTPDARGLYQVSLELREVPAGSRHQTLVLNREPWADNAELAGDVGNGFQLPAVSAGGFRTSGAGGLSGARPAGWVRLLDGVRSLQLDYFDPRLNAWVDKWNDPTMAPSLVRVRLALENGGAPYEFIERVPSGGVPRGALNTALINAPAPVMRGLTPPSAPPPGPPPQLPAGLRPPTGLPPNLNPGSLPGQPPSFNPGSLPGPPPTFNPGNMPVPPRR